jgi:hypothetical protein
LKISDTKKVWREIMTLTFLIFVVAFFSSTFCFAQDRLLELPKFKELSIGLTASIGDLSDARDFGAYRAYHSYEKFVQRSQLSFAFEQNGIETLSSLEARFKDSAQNLDEWNNAGVQRRSEILSEFSQSLTGISIDPTIIQSEYAVQYAIQNPDNWASEFESLGNSGALSIEDKMLIASQLGGQFGEKYNLDRASDGVGVVTIEQLFASLASGSPGGVCRDISKAQGQILNALGVPEENIYLVSYSTPGGSHAILAVSDPDNPQKILKANYDYYSESPEGIEESALLQENGRLIEAGQAYKIYNLRGEPIGMVPTEVNSVLREVFDSQLKKRSRTNFNLLQVSADSNFGTTLAFGAQTAGGDKIKGLGQQFSLALNQSTDFRFSLAYYQRGASRNGGDLDQEVIYGSMEQDFRFYQTGSELGTSTVLGLMTILEAQFALNKFTDVSGATHESEGVEANGFVVLYGDWKQRLNQGINLTAGAGAIGFLGFKNISAGKSEGFTPSFDQFYANGGLEIDFGRGILDAEAGVVLRQYGETGHAEVGYRMEQHRLFGGLTSPLSEATPGFTPDSARQIYAGYDHGCGPRVGSAYFSRNIDNGTVKTNLDFRFLLDRNPGKTKCRINH